MMKGWVGFTFGFSAAGQAIIECGPDTLPFPPPFPALWLPDGED